jgi:hypothetical protein
MYLWRVRKLYINNEVMATGLHWNGRLESCSDKQATTKSRQGKLERGEQPIVASHRPRDDTLTARSSLLWVS